VKFVKVSSLILLILIVIIVLSGTLISLKVKGQVKELFRLNKTLQEEGYYMAEFEFQLLGFAYLLDKGEYLGSLTKLSDYHHKLKSREGLIKIPEFSSTQEEIAFYLSLQDPDSGAFMDPSAPFCTYYSITENIISHIEALSDSSTSADIQLHYPLSFLDDINSPENLVAYLNDISYVDWLGSRFPQTSFHFARDLFSNVMLDNVIVKNGLYSFSPEWKYTMLKWMYEFQDPDTGLWGPKDEKTNVLRKMDISNTYSIVKKYRNMDGEDIHPKFPLRFEKKIFSSVLAQLSNPMPDTGDLSAIHEYNLEQAKGIKLLLSRLWPNASEEHKAAAKKIIEDFVVLSFENYYVEQDGAFSYYPHADHATADGMSNMILDSTGALSVDRQTIYWGDPASNALDLGTIIVKDITEKNLDIMGSISGVNAWRIYADPPDFKALQDNVWILYYPHTTKVLDITELVPNIIRWTETSSQSTGNWKSMADIKNQFGKYTAETPPIVRQKFPFDKVNRKLEDETEIYIVGFDVLQVPRFRIEIQSFKDL